jgi:hypothetical protein
VSRAAASTSSRRPRSIARASDVSGLAAFMPALYTQVS